MTNTRLGSIARAASADPGCLKSGLIERRAEYGFSMSIPGPPLVSMILLPQRLPELPPAREFVTSAGFGGAAALVAALLVVGVALIALTRASKHHRQRVDQQEHHFEQLRNQQEHTAAVQRCWRRFVWVVETAGIEPASYAATVGLGPDLALELLRGLLRDSEELGEGTLRDAVQVHLNQFSLLLAQQSNAVPKLVTAPEAETDPASASPSARDEQAPASQASAAPSSPTTTTEDGPTKKVAVTGRRRRQ